MAFDSPEKAAEYARSWYHRNKHRRDTPEFRKRNAETAARWRKNHPEKAVFSAAKARAKKLGYDFNITLDDIIIPDVCPILLIPLNREGGDQVENSFALDRVDNSKGYVKGNVQIISHKANRHKADLSIDEIRRLYKYSLKAVEGIVVFGEGGSD